MYLSHEIASKVKFDRGMRQHTTVFFKKKKKIIPLNQWTHKVIRASKINIYNFKINNRQLKRIDKQISMCALMLLHVCPPTVVTYIDLFWSYRPTMLLPVIILWTQANRRWLALSFLFVCLMNLGFIVRYFCSYAKQWRIMNMLGHLMQMGHETL